MSDDNTKAVSLRERAAKVRAAADQLIRGAESSPDQERLLRLQAGILNDGAARLDDEALAIQPPRGRA